MKYGVNLSKNYRQPLYIVFNSKEHKWMNVHKYMNQCTYDIWWIG